MFQKRLVLCTIPARGGSKRLPGKNLKTLNGKPLIAYAIGAARGSSYVDRVIVSTDSKKIATAAKKYGAEVLVRPASLAKDSTPTLPVVLHALAQLKKHRFSPDIHVLVQPTSPLITARDIDHAIEHMAETKTDACVSVCEISSRPEWMYSVHAGLLVPFMRQARVTAWQRLPELFRLNGGVFVTKVKALGKGFVIRGKTSAYVMPKERSVDIDDAVDFALAESLMKRKSV